jgi:hypothetical protein
MTPVELVTALHTVGCRLIPEGEYLRVQDPQHALTENLRQAIREHKAALLGLLSQPMPAADAVQPTAATPPAPLTRSYPCVVCGRTVRWDDRGIWRCVACWPPQEVTPVLTPIPALTERNDEEGVWEP